MKRNKGAANQITEGVIWKQILVFFFPILLGSFFQQFYNTIDMVIVGRFVGTEALASVGGSSGQIVNLVVGFFTGLSAAARVNPSLKMIVLNYPVTWIIAAVLFIIYYTYKKKSYCSLRSQQHASRCTETAFHAVSRCCPRDFRANLHDNPSRNSGL